MKPEGANQPLFTRGLLLDRLMLLLLVFTIIGAIGGCIALRSYCIASVKKFSLVPTAEQIRPHMNYAEVFALLPTNLLQSVEKQKGRFPVDDEAVVLNSNVTVDAELVCVAESGFLLRPTYPDALHVYFNREGQTVGLYLYQYGISDHWKPTWGISVGSIGNNDAKDPQE
ncbi:MAG: hypothetical protein HYV36_02730 [Lentisphaerae bacterium]|nr:hypothetical protein [Lentisphaerota bacterium]